MLQGASIILAVLTTLGHIKHASLHQHSLRWQKIDVKGISPNPRQDVAMGFDAARNRVTVYGGRSSVETFSDTWILDIANKNWTRINDTLDDNGALVPGPKYGAIYETDGNDLVVAFGTNGGKLGASNKIYRFEFNSTKWISIDTTSGNPAERFQSKGTMINRYLYVSHGQGDSDLLSDAQRLNLNTKGWQRIHDDANQYNPDLPHARYGHGLTSLLNNQLLLYGGCLSGKDSAGPCPSGDTWLFNINKSQWVKLENCPSARIFPDMTLLPNSTESSAIAVLFGGKETGNQVIKIYGEAKESEILIYDTLKMEWTYREALKDPVFGYPTLRYGHAMVTIREGVLIFGGASTSNEELLNDVWILKGDIEAARKSSITRRRSGSRVNMIMLHGIFMFLSWGVLIQLGAFVARYMRHEEKWLTAHRILMVSGLSLAIVGFGLGIASFQGNHFSFVHGAIGLDIMLAGLYQPLNGAFRPAPPIEGEKPKLWRRIWEISHRLTGRLALLLSMINISLGLFLSLATKTIWISWFTYLGLIIIGFIVAEIRFKMKKKKIEVSEVGLDNSMPLS